jgi:catecholate siderophore receptor
VQDQITLAKNWKALLGLRFDHFKVDFDDRRTTTPAQDLSRTDNNLSPRAGLIWSPTSNSTYYAAYSYAFLPSAEQLALAVNTANLAPERAKNYEVGARWDVLPKLRLSSSLFRTDRENVRNNDPANPGFFVQTGQQRTDGMEIGLQGEVARFWLVHAGFSFLDGRILKGTSVAAAGQRLQLVPQRTLSVWNRFDLGGGWGTGLGVIQQSQAFASISNAVTLPQFWRADGALYYVFNSGKTRLALNVENLFDRNYFPTADGDNNISPGAPRSARLTLTTKF